MRLYRILLHWFRNKEVAFFLAFATVIAWICPLEGWAAQTAKPLEVKIMTFNIRYGTANDGENHWEKRKDLVFAVIRDSGADIIGLQEALLFQIQEIQTAVKGYDSVGVGRDDGREKGEFSNILYRKDRFSVESSGTFWLSDTPETPGSRTWGNTIPRICTWARLIEKKTGKAFYAFNTHLDHISQPSREKSAVLLSRRIAERQKKSDPFLLTGDFNAGEDNLAILYLKGDAYLAEIGTTPQIMADTFRILHPNDRETGTFNGFSGRKDGDKIDYIFTSKDTLVLEAAILYTNQDGRYPSDHFPVTARLRLAVPSP
ncbi:MAG: endonuclease/exonuclease/phosphatase family protein [Sedimentisphaerales bacterium]|nr:endonuclease/exonuclease/phosphatase family protein [Sedimentisphaerales bacterium]